MRVACLLFASLTFPADWSSFRGPNGSGVAEATGIPSEFGPHKNIVWRTPVAPGSSSPVLAGDSLYLTAYENKELHTLKIDAKSGGILWRRIIPHTRSEARHQLNNPASPSPVTDGANVYVFFSDFGLLSYGPDGNERWRLPLGPFSNFHGMGASPILAGNKLILVCDQDTVSYLLAVDINTGKQLWKTPRQAVVHGFATASLFRAPSGEEQIIVPGSYLLAAYALADGKELWSVRGLSWQIKATAVVDGDTIYATGWAPGADPGQAKPLPPFEEAVKQADTNNDGKLSNAELPAPWKHGGSWTAIDLDNDGALDSREWGFYRARREANNVNMAVKPGNARGDLTSTHVTWKHQRMVPEVPSPLLLDGVLYTVKTGGIFTSMLASTGEVKKSARIPGAIDSYYSSPVVADGKLFLCSEQGKVAVLKPGGEWQVLQVNDFEEPIYATPAIAGRRMYIRTASALYAVGAAPAK
ncbi:MAG: PQQ-binding-like beta-propeller repeat protein [Acidobacteria bacterium]|nr:PQQ-binding-like beta-propeller repeat protein [Acidobacteriota bacterium]